MRKLILHIGCEKTGSTSIQNFLFENRDHLLKSHGILYPDSLGGRNHTKLAIYACDPSRNLTRFLPKGQSLDEFRVLVKESFQEQVKNSSATTVLISNEWLHPRIRQAEEFDRLKELCEGIFDGVEVVLYIRQQDKLALSLYSTSLKAGNYKKFSFPSVESGELPYYFDFFSIYDNWASAFGEDNISVRVFDRDKLIGGDVVKDFLSILDLHNDEFAYPPEENLSLSDSGVIVMRGFNFLSNSFRGFVTPRKLRKIREIISNKFKGKPELASENECKCFLDSFQESNQHLADRLADKHGYEIEIFGLKGGASSSQHKKVIRLGFMDESFVLVRKPNEIIINLYPITLMESWQAANQLLVSAFKSISEELNKADVVVGGSELLYIDVRKNSHLLIYDGKVDFIINQSMMKYTSYFKKKENFKKKYFMEQDFFYKNLEEWEDKLYVRYGIVELRALYSYIFRSADLPAVFQRIVSNLDDSRFMCANRFEGGFLSPYDTEFNIKRLLVNAGFYSSKNDVEHNLKDFECWADNYLKGIKNADYLFRCAGSYVNFLPIEFMLNRHSCQFKQYVNPLGPEQFYKMLQGRKVMLVSPFADQLNLSFASGRMKQLYVDLEIPDFDFKAIKAPMTIYPNRVDDGWFDTFQKLCLQIEDAYEDYKFDIFYASAGCYGIPLCNFVFEKFGVSSVYIGNQVNTLFGVKQKTNEDFMPGRKKLENWVPSHLSSIPGISRIDRGRYI